MSDTDYSMDEWYSRGKQSPLRCKGDAHSGAEHPRVIARGTDKNKKLIEFREILDSSIMNRVPDSFCHARSKHVTHTEHAPVAQWIAYLTSNQ